MSPDRMRFEEIVASKLPMISTSICTNIANELIAAGATLSETANWILPKDAVKNRPYCSRCGEDALFDGWGFPKWSVRCPNCGAIMSNAKEK